MNKFKTFTEENEQRWKYKKERRKLIKLGGKGYTRPYRPRQSRRIKNGVLLEKKRLKRQTRENVREREQARISRVTQSVFFRFVKQLLNR